MSLDRKMKSKTLLKPFVAAGSYFRNDIPAVVSWATLT